MRLIYTHDNVVVLHSVKNILALNSIESFVKNEHSIPIGARHGINNTFHELWILYDQDYQKARSVIEKEIDCPVTKDSWICSHCNEENAGSFDICWKCQSVPANK